jgi:polyphenol oxidase
MKFLTTDLAKHKWLSHGFFTRIGGASAGIYATLNCAWGSADDPEHIRMNREKVAETLGLAPDNILTLSQVHSPRVITVTDAWSREKIPEGDALVTDRRGLGLAVQTADCAPILFAAGKARVIGAAHAGWKGAVGGVLEATVEAMKKLGAEPADISAAIGPCIGPQSYEVSSGFDAPFLAQDPANAQFFKKAAKEGHLMFDLPGYVAHRLRLLGLREVHDTRQDTLANEAAYFSYRRTTQRGEKDYGRQISVIAIK